MGVGGSFVHIILHADGPLLPRPDLIEPLLVEFYYLVIVFMVAGFVGVMARRDDRAGFGEIADFIEATASGQASEKRRRLDELTSAFQPGDRLVVSELSQLGRSLGQVVAVLDALAKAGVAFVALKENIRVEGRPDIQTKVMTTLR